MKTSIRKVRVVKCENKHQKSESCHPCLAQSDKTISEVKLIVSFTVCRFHFNREITRVDTRVDISTQTNGNLDP